MRVCVYTARDKQRQCIASAVHKIFPAVAPFSHSLPSLPAIPASRKIHRRKTDTSRSKVRILFPGTLLPCVFSSRSPHRLGRPLFPPPPSLFSLFFPFSFAFFPSAVFPLYPPHPQRDGITRQNCRMQTCKP